jgi:hypothetical protein
MTKTLPILTILHKGASEYSLLLREFSRGHRWLWYSPSNTRSKVWYPAESSVFSKGALDLSWFPPSVLRLEVPNWTRNEPFCKLRIQYLATPPNVPVLKGNIAISPPFSLEGFPTDAFEPRLGHTLTSR